MLKLERPLVCLDLETTGVNAQQDRIVEIGTTHLHPDSSTQSWASLINPGIPIPPAATAIHGITDEDVKDAPFFVDLAPHIGRFLEGFDFCGFNIILFDLPLLEAEFARTPVPFSREGRHIVDVQRIFQKLIPHSLAGAVKFYLGREHEGAHRAKADVDATIEVLKEQLSTGGAEVPHTVPELSEFCTPKDWATPDGKFKIRDGAVCFNFGKWFGRSLEEVAIQTPSYLSWILTTDFSPQAKQLCRDALEATAWKGG